MTPAAGKPSPDAVARMLLLADPHDQQLLTNCHPPTHVNPTPQGKYNLVAIGAGAAGLVSAGGTGSLGGKAALIERGLLGGDCLNVGCVPSKAVIRAARAVYDARRSASFGVQLPDNLPIDFAVAMERMRRLRAHISPNDSVKRFREEFGVDVFLGEAKFVSPSEIEVAGQRLTFDRAVIATGGRPAELSLPGLHEANAFNNETIFTLTELPRRLAVIGGGPIGCELAQAFARFGSQVTVLTDGARLLPREDDEAAALIAWQFQRENISVLTQVRLQRVTQRNADQVIAYEHNGQEKELLADVILVAAGRVPNIEDLGLDAAGISYTRDGVLVDDLLRTTNARVYAAGDVCSQYKFTHAADAMARMVLRNALFFGREKVGNLVMPWVTYTDPEVAHVGFYEESARAAEYDVATLTEHFADVDRAILDGEEEGFARVHYDRRTGRILGGTIVARHAGEMISELTLAITQGLKLAALSATIHPYPTQAEVLRKLGDAYNRQRLTPTVRKLFQRWLAWRRT